MNNENMNMEFGEYFRELRKTKKLTQAQIAAYIGKSKMLVSGVETGKNGAFLDEDIEKISNLMELTDKEKQKLFYEASKARERLPAYLSSYMHRHGEVYDLLEIMVKEEMSTDTLRKIKSYAEGLASVKNN